jgi:transposase
MALDITRLPDDPQQLKQWLVGREALIEQLLSEIARLKRWRFGRSAESLDPAGSAQLPLDAAMLSLVPAKATTDALSVPKLESTQAKARTGLPRRAPRELPPELPRIVQIHAAADCACPACGGRLRRLGDDVSEQLDYVPGYFQVIRHIRPKLSCALCSHIVQATAPPRPIERGLPTAGLLAQVIASKYADHCPLHRQEGIYRRSGVELPRAMLASWVGEAAAVLAPLVDAMGRYVLAAEKLHAEDTPVPVLDPGRGRTRTARLWAYVRDDRPSSGVDPPAVWYRYSPDRRGERPQAHLAPFRGILQADGYSGFKALYQHGRIIEAACWAHARRKFYDLYVADRSPLAAEALRRIGLLYAIEREIRGQSTATRAEIRADRSGPMLAAFKSWLDTTLLSVSAKSPLASAIQYARGRWEALTRFVNDGRVEIDNNAAERAIRALVLGRRNYLFAGSDAGGESAARLYSLIGTARLNGIDPYRYLRHVLERIATHPINRIEELLPWRVAAALCEPARRAA